MPESVNCPDCKHHIGYDIEVEGLHLLQIGGVPIWDTKLACPECGRVMYWSIRDRAVEQAIKRSRAPDATH